MWRGMIYDLWLLCVCVCAFRSSELHNLFLELSSKTLCCYALRAGQVLKENHESSNTQITQESNWDTPLQFDIDIQILDIQNNHILMEMPLPNHHVWGVILIRILRVSSWCNSWLNKIGQLHMQYLKLHFFATVLQLQALCNWLPGWTGHDTKWGKWLIFSMNQSLDSWLFRGHHLRLPTKGSCAGHIPIIPSWSIKGIGHQADDLPARKGWFATVTQKRLLLLMAEILHQLRLVVYPIIYRVSYIPGGARFQPSTVPFTFLHQKDDACTSFVEFYCFVKKKHVTWLPGCFIH